MTVPFPYYSFRISFKRLNAQVFVVEVLTGRELEKRVGDFCLICLWFSVSVEIASIWSTAGYMNCLFTPFFCGELKPRGCQVLIYCDPQFPDTSNPVSHHINGLCGTGWSCLLRPVRTPVSFVSACTLSLIKSLLQTDRYWPGASQISTSSQAVPQTDRVQGSSSARRPFLL